ncbi:MAG: nuclear transport factor 2 family protein [Gemmatimonadetes bacterium]|nr:nuclear transport factor 2 family protein [Gemmatimonadota bacterium]
MKKRTFGAVLAVLVVGGCATPEQNLQDHDPALLEAVLEDIRVGWEQGDGEPFFAHFLDGVGARYFEGGGENVGLQDLVTNHVEPEAELGLRLGFSNIETHFEGGFAWALVDTDIQLTTSDGRDIHNQGHGTYLFRWVGSSWRIVHTQSASSPVRAADPEAG